MQRFFEFFRRKNYGALWSNLLNRFYKDFDTSPIKVEIRPEGSSKWLNITNGDHHLQSEQERMQGYLYKKYEIRVTNETNGKLYVAALMMNNDMAISSAPFDGQVIELEPKTSKLFYDHMDDTFGAVVVDKYKEFYNWKAEFFHFKFIVNNFENFSDILPEFVQPALPNPITNVRKGDEKMVSKGGIVPRDNKPRKWGTLKTTIWLNNPHYNEIHGKLAKNWDDYQKDERLSPFFEHLYFDTQSVIRWYAMRI
ncbi:MAG: hypothetical protein ACJAYJ_004007 [Saprospiraceae bacterium]|jgi:hypothetical protein